LEGVIRLHNLEFLDKVKCNGIVVTWNTELPLLRLLKFKDYDVYGNDKVSDIIRQFIDEPNKKKKILDCQKALIDASFVENAGY
jgi:hypothetical protein